METILPSKLNFFAKETQAPRPFFETHPTVISTIRTGPILLFGLYAFIFFTYASRNFKSYRKGHRDVIIIHALSGLSELSRFYLPFSTPSPTPDTVQFSAVILCFIQCATNMILVRKLGRGCPALVRPVYQTGAIFRMSLILAAYILNSQDLYHDSIVIIHAFAYTRLICFLFTTASTGFSDTEVPEYNTSKNDSNIARQKTSLSTAQTYTAAVYGSALMVMGQMHNPMLQRYAAVGFLAGVGIVMRIENWVTASMQRIAEDKLERRTPNDKIVFALYAIGFSRLNILVEMDRKINALN